MTEFALTLDLEDDWSFDDPSLDHLVLDHLDQFIDLMADLNLPLSVFVVGRTIERYPEKVERLRSSLECEFHLHSYEHDLSKRYDFETEVRRGKQAYQEFFGRPPRGYRAPQGNIDTDEFAILETLGFDFDSSVFPSYRPGTYNNLDAPTSPFRPDGVSSLLEIPLGTFPGIRVPTSLSYFKLFGQPLSRYLTYSPLPSILVYNVHLHDFYRTKSHDALDAPKRWIMKRNIENAEEMFRSHMSTIQARGYLPVTMSEIYERCNGTGTPPAQDSEIPVVRT